MVRFTECGSVFGGVHLDVSIPADAAALETRFEAAPTLF
jgi:hypothetical protein